MHFYNVSKFTSISILLFSLVACGETAEAPQAGARPATAIDVAKVISKPVQAWFTYTTRLEAPQQVALKPRVSGIVEATAFVEGQVVKEGDLLFRLDPRPFAAEVARLKAQIESQKAAYEQAKSEAERAERLSKRNAISAEEAESRVTLVKQAEAQIAALRAQLTAAQLDLDFTNIKSPIDGIISRGEITKGNTVTANQSILTNIVSNDKMYAYFDIDERTWNQYFAQISAVDELPVVMQLLGNDKFSLQGNVDFIDNQINVSTGTLRVRATFAAQHVQLRAGSFARVRIASQQAQDRVLVPEKSIGSDLNNRFVLVLDNDNVLQYRLVTLGDIYGEFRAITSGLQSGDIIAVNGPAKVGPGMPVVPNRVELEASTIAFTLAAQLEQALLAKR